MLSAARVLLTAPFVHASPWLAARLFESFARSEWESRLDLVQAAALTSSPVRAALYLRHAEDEARHTRVFERRAGELHPGYGGAHRVEAVVQPAGLYAALGELDFLAFVHHGEQRALRELEIRQTIVRLAGDDRSARMLSAVLLDERRHAAYTWQLLVELVGAHEAGRRVRVQRVREAMRLFRRRGLTLVRPLSVMALMLIYLVVGPLLTLTTRIRRA